MNWCKNDLHSKPMVCGRKNFLNRSDFAKERNKKKKDKYTGGNDINSVFRKFKITLAAITSPKDFKALQEQFSLIKY